MRALFFGAGNGRKRQIWTQKACRKRAKMRKKRQKMLFNARKLQQFMLFAISFNINCGTFGSKNALI
jgi:hypothetical protein